MIRMLSVCPLVLLSFVLTFSASGQTGRQATLKGIVTDSNEARVPNVPIILTSDSGGRKANTNDFGEYEIALEPGKYKVSVGGALGFGVTRRSEIFLGPNARTNLNLKLYLSD